MNEKVVPQGTGVAVIIPCYSHYEWLPEALESVQRQTVCPEYVWVIVDSIADDVRRIPYQTLLHALNGWGIHQVVWQCHAGVSSVRNTGFRSASEAGCEWVIPLDEDDMLRPRYVERMLQSAEACPWAKVHYPDWNEFGDTLAHHRTDEYSFDRLLAAPYIPVTSMIHVDVWKAVKEANGEGFDTGLTRRGLRWEDYLFFLEAGALGFEMARVGLGLLRVRRHGPSGTSIANETIPEWRSYTSAKLERLYGIETPWVEDSVNGSPAHEVRGK